MKLMKFKMLAVIAALSFGQAQAEDKIDMDTDAQWDGVNFLRQAVGIDSHTLDFEAGFIDGQAVDGWLTIGNGNAVRFGFGESAGAVQWGAEIAEVGGQVTAFGPDDKPRGSAVSGQYFLSDGAPSNGSSFFLMQFAKPIDFLSFASYNYGGDTGVIPFSFQTFLGESFASATLLADTGLLEHSTYQTSGNLGAYVLSTNRAQRTPFDLVAMRLDHAAPGVGFDNFGIRTVSAVPETETAALMLLGLGALVARGRKTKRC